MSKENENIFQNGYDDGFGLHNVGPGVLRASNREVIKKVADHYGPRCGHIPDHHALRTGVIVYNTSETIQRQLDYLNKLTGRKFEQISIEDFSTNSGLVVPYINDEATENYLKERGAKVWGLPSEMVNKLKNKAESHIWMREAHIDGIELPYFEISDVSGAARAGERVLRKTEELYAKVGMRSQYQLGVMMRAAESDGNYGACMVYQDEGGKIHVVPDGDPSFAITEIGWKKAFEKARIHLESTMNVEKENRVVISRLIDLADSPGLSVFVVDGEVYPLGWNGQAHPEGGTACIGTSSYVPTTSLTERILREEAENSFNAFAALLKKTAESLKIDFKSVRGAANMDLMISGPQELELQKRLGINIPIYVAEVNPRLTNLTDALMLALWIEKKPITFKNLKSRLASGLQTVDRFKFPKDFEVEKMRDKIIKLDSKLQKEGTRIIVRMPDNPMGLILIGDTNLAQKKLDNLQKEIKL